MKKLLLAVSCIAISFGVNASINNSVSIESVRVNITDINVAIEAGQEKSTNVFQVLQERFLEVLFAVK